MSTIRAVLARELHARGMSVNEIARLLGVTPAAVSMYISGKRGREHVELNDAVREAIKRLADSIASSSERPERIDITPLVKLALASPSRSMDPETIREMIRVEQETAQSAMALAYKVRHPMLRIALMQIATDSLRHAEILSVLLDYLEGRLRLSDDDLKNEIKSIRRDLELIMDEERKMQEYGDVGGGDLLVSVLLRSILHDEIKHIDIVKMLLNYA